MRALLLLLSLALAFSSCAGEVLPGPRGGRDAGSADAGDGGSGRPVPVQVCLLCDDRLAEGEPDHTATCPVPAARLALSPPACEDGIGGPP